MGVEVYSVSTDTHFVHKAWHDASRHHQEDQVPDARRSDRRTSAARSASTSRRRASPTAARFVVNPEGKIKLAEIHDNGIGRNAEELVRKVQAAQFVASHAGEVCPAKWTPGRRDAQARPRPRRQDLSRRPLAFSTRPARPGRASGPSLRPTRRRNAPCSTTPSSPSCKDLFAELAVRAHARPAAEPDHPKQAELRELLERRRLGEPAASASSSRARSPTRVQFELLKDGAPTGMRFRGIPGGHEFTSLVLAILNADGKGKLPDEAVRRRVQALRGPIELRTYVSLSCTNCPDVVQALNQMALLHGDFRHEMVDGGLAEAEVARLGHPGRARRCSPATKLAARRQEHASRELLDVAREPLRPREAPAARRSAAARAARLRRGRGRRRTRRALGRHLQRAQGAARPRSSRRSSAARCGRPSASRTSSRCRTPRGCGSPPTSRSTCAATRSTCSRTARSRRSRPGELKELLLKGGEVLRAQSLILATGAKWRELGVPGEKEYIGRGVAFCPHCDGPFYKGKRVAVVGGGNSGVEAAIDLAGICAHVTLVEFLDKLKADEVLVRKLQVAAQRRRSSPTRAPPRSSAAPAG